MEIKRSNLCKNPNNHRSLISTVTIMEIPQRAAVRPATTGVTSSLFVCCAGGNFSAFCSTAALKILMLNTGEK